MPDLTSLEIEPMTYLAHSNVFKPLRQTFFPFSIRTECVEIESGGSRVESTMIELESEQTVEYRSSSALSKQQKANKSFYPPPITTRKRLTFTVPTPQKQGGQ